MKETPYAQPPQVSQVLRLKGQQLENQLRDTQTRLATGPQPTRAHTFPIVEPTKLLLRPNSPQPSCSKTPNSHGVCCLSPPSSLPLLRTRKHVQPAKAHGSLLLHGTRRTASAAEANRG